MTDWVNATFSTLEEYNILVSEVATIKEQIVAVNDSIINLETGAVEDVDVSAIECEYICSLSLNNDNIYVAYYDKLVCNEQVL